MRLSLQFHAVRDELASMTWAWAQEAEVPLVWESAGEPRFSLEPLNLGQGPRSPGPQVLRIWLPARSPQTVVKDSQEFIAANPDVLSVYIGLETDDFLRETVLGGVTENAVVMKSWRSIKRALVGGMSKGAWVVGATGVRVREDGHYFTPGAKALAAGGKRMLAVAGGVEFLLD